MKIILNPTRNICGSTLLVTALLAVIAGSTLGYYLMRTQNECFQVNRSQAWNKALVVAEAGLEEGMALINRNCGNPVTTTNWYDGAASDGWSVNTSSTFPVYSITRSLGTNLGSYTVYVTNAGSSPIILSVGTAYGRTAGMNVSPVTRRVTVDAFSSSGFPGAITVKGSVDMAGNNVTVDSYDSGDPLHSIWPNYPFGRGYGLYTNTESTHNLIRKANGNVATDGLVINVGNANVYGHVDTAPGGNTAVKANGSVGSVTWVDASKTGVEPGYSTDDMNVVFPDVLLPATNWTVVTGNSITNSGYYTMDQISANFSITATNVVLYLTNGINFNGNKSFDVSSNASVTIYAGTIINDGGNGTINNNTQLPSRMIIYGLPSLTSITIHGNGSMNAAIYAPEADVTYKGSGSAGGFNGALTANSVKLTGTSSFSYDEALGKLNLKGGYVVKSWREVVANY